MTPEPCPVCKGKCCRDSYGYKLTHMGDEFYEHTCETCEDGTKFIPPRTAKDERADVVAWLNHARSYDAIASARFIASGGHVGWAKGEKP